MENQNKMVVTMTTEELQKIVADAINKASEKNHATEHPPMVTDPTKRYVFGIRGIASLFGVSTRTAQQWKSGFLADAVTQRGRTIVTDVDKAMNLFANAKVV